MDHPERTAVGNDAIRSDEPTATLLLFSEPEFAITGNGNVDVSQGDPTNHDDEQHPLLEADASSPGLSSRSRHAPAGVTVGSSASPSNATLSPGGLSGVTVSSVSFAIPSHPMRHEVPGAPRIPPLTIRDLHLVADDEDDGQDSLDTDRSSVPTEEIPIVPPSDIPLYSVRPRERLEITWVNGRITVGRLPITTDTPSFNRAETSIKCMEVVPDELVLRYEKLRSSDCKGVDGCAICHDNLVDEAPNGDSNAIEASPASPNPSVAFPCAGKHLFHTQCLLPWLERNATCPSCRFNIDPRSMLWLHHLQSAWKPPQVEIMNDWLAAEEKAKEAGVPRERPDVIMPEYPAPAPRMSSRSESDPGRVYDFLMSTFDDPTPATPSASDSGDFERDFAAWFTPSAVDSLSL